MDFTNKVFVVAALLAFCFGFALATRVDIDSDWLLPKDQLFLDEENIIKAGKSLQEIGSQKDEELRLLKVARDGLQLEPETSLALLKFFKKYYDSKGPDSADKSRALKRMIDISVFPESQCDYYSIMMSKTWIELYPDDVRVLQPYLKHCHTKHAEACKSYLSLEKVRITGDRNKESLADLAQLFGYLEEAHKSSQTTGDYRDEHFARAVYSFLKAKEAFSSQKPLSQIGFEDECIRLVYQPCKNIEWKLVTFLESYKRLTNQDRDEFFDQDAEKWQQQADACRYLWNNDIIVTDKAFEIYKNEN